MAFKRSGVNSPGSTIIIANVNKYLASPARETVATFALAAAAPNKDEIQSKVGLCLLRLGEAHSCQWRYQGPPGRKFEGMELRRRLPEEPGNRQLRTDIVPRCAACLLSRRWSRNAADRGPQDA